MIDVKDLIQEYFEKVGGKYNISFERFNAICRAPFMFFRKQMEAPDFPTIHVKYFGKFTVFPGSAKNMLRFLEYKKGKGELTEEQFDERTVNLKAYIHDLERQVPASSDREKTPN
jgi:hypothetical protein